MTPAATFPESVPFTTLTVAVFASKSMSADTTPSTSESWFRTCETQETPQVMPSTSRTMVSVADATGGSDGAGSGDGDGGFSAGGDCGAVLPSSVFPVPFDSPAQAAKSSSPQMMALAASIFMEGPLLLSSIIRPSVPLNRARRGNSCSKAISPPDPASTERVEPS